MDMDLKYWKAERILAMTRRLVPIVGPQEAIALAIGIVDDAMASANMPNDVDAHADPQGK